MKFNINAFLGCAFVLSSQLGFAQAPGVEWQKSYWGTTYPTSPQQPTPPPGPNGTLPLNPNIHESSEDWFYFHAISKGTDNKPNGYICGGYSRFINYVEHDGPTGCFADAALGSFDCIGFEKPNYKYGNSKQVLALIDLNGNLQWYKTFSNGDISNVIQTSDGGYISIGAGKSTEDGLGNSVAYNPGQTPGHLTDYFIHGQADVGVTSQPRKIRIIKVDRNGNKLWEYMYGMESFVGNGSAAFAKESRTTGGSAGGGIVETSEGDIMFTAGAYDAGVNNKRTCVIRIDNTGKWKWGRFYESSTLGLSSHGNYILKTGTGSGQNFYISGTETTPSSGEQAYLLKIDNSNAPNPIWTTYHGRTLSTANDGSWAGSTLAVNTTGELIVPIVHNVSNEDYNGYKAEAVVYRVNPNTGYDINSTSFGPICAYDLTVGVTATADGGFAVVSSTHRNYNASDPQYYFPDASNDGNNCSYVGKFKLYKDYGFNDGYVAKCDPLGGLDWETTFDNNIAGSRPPGSPNTWAYPDPLNRDLRRTECLYTIVQSPDGGFTMVGNNSENFDDSYIVKLASTCTNKTLSNLTINTSGPSLMYSATDYITASTVIIPAGPAGINFRVGNDVNLLPGFRSDFGSIFLADIDPSIDCTPNSYKKGGTNETIPVNNVPIKSDRNILNIFPNPNNGIFTVVAEGQDLKSVYVYNITGDLIFEKTSISDQQFNVDITEQPKGLYFVKVLEGNQVKSGKIIHQ